MNPEIVCFAAGVASVLAAHAVAWLALRIWRGASAASVAEGLRAAAERRARDAEDRLRLAELEIARGGAHVEPVKKVTVRPVR